MKFEVLKTSVGEWLKGTGPESDIVMSSRVRLARNLGTILLSVGPQKQSVVKLRFFFVHI